MLGKVEKTSNPKMVGFFNGDESHGTPPNDATGPTPSIATTWGAAKQSPYKSDMVLDGLVEAGTTQSFFGGVIMCIYIFVHWDARYPRLQIVRKEDDELYIMFGRG